MVVGYRFRDEIGKVWVVTEVNEEYIDWSVHPTGTFANEAAAKPTLFREFTNDRTS
jgi:hypothetical protein